MIRTPNKTSLQFLLALGLVMPSFAFAQDAMGGLTEEQLQQLDQVQGFRESLLNAAEQDNNASSNQSAQPSNHDGVQVWNLNEVDIRTYIRQVAELTGKNFIIDPRVQGKVTLLSEKSLDKKEAYQALLSTLDVHGYSAIQTGNVIKIVPQDNAKTSGTPVIQQAKNNDEAVTKVFNLKYINPSQAMNTLRGLVGKSGHLAPNDETQSLIVVDNASNVHRIEEIIAKMDRADNQNVDIIPVQHASAYELADTLTKLLSKNASNRKINMDLGFDERTNSILVTGGSSDARDEVRKLVHKLDKSTEDQYNSEVIYLKYAKATEIAPIIGSFLEEAMRTSTEGAIRKESEKAGGQTTGTIAAPSAPADFSSHLTALKSFEQTGGAQSSLFKDNESGAKSGVLNRFVQWEESTNSLIVKAPPTIMRAVKNIIGKLDIRRPQVLIEVIIAEVNLNRARELGVEWNPSAKGDFKFGTRFPGTNAANGLVGNFSPGTITQLGTGISVGIFNHGNLRLLLKALASDSSANILSTPNLVTLDNQSALIKVGQKVPFAVGETNNQNVGGNPFTSFDREEVGLSLTIKPQITPSGAIKLQIENILSNVVAGTAAQNAGGNPITSERSILTNVMIDDGKILVLGGLMQDSWQEVRSQVPLLGDIPFIGRFFGSRNKTLVKQNLMVFIRPIILRDDVEGIRLSNEKYDHFRHAQTDAYDVLDRPLVDEPVVLPPLDAKDYYPSSAKHNAAVDNYPGVMLPHPFEG